MRCVVVPKSWLTHTLQFATDYENGDPIFRRVSKVMESRTGV
jgi:hypothetical protein